MHCIERFPNLTKTFIFYSGEHKSNMKPVVKYLHKVLSVDNPDTKHSTKTKTVVESYQLKKSKFGLIKIRILGELCF